MMEKFRMLSIENFFWSYREVLAG
jgi:hypothetical protein